jgi:hypothetical protein
MQTDIQSELSRIIEFVQRPWWARWGFWIGLIATFVGVPGSILGLVIDQQYEQKARIRYLPA